MAALVLVTIGLCVLALLTLLHLALPFPYILDDEYRYSQLARYGLPLPGSAVANFPVFLYSSTFRWVASCGEGFLPCARFMNVLFLVASLLPLYRTARLFMDRRWAVTVAAFAIAAPIHTFTAYFMAEAMYFFLFWIFVWFVLSRLHHDPLQLGGGAGAIVALLTLVKPHGLVVLGAAAAFVLVLAMVRRPIYSFRWLSKVLIAAALGFLVVRFGVGYILAGRQGLDIFGAYRGQVTPMANLARSSSRLGRVLQILWGHLGALMLLFSIPIAIAVSYLPRLAKPAPRPEYPSRPDLAELSLFTIVFLGVLVLFFAKFTADISGAEAARFLSRYYDFAFPLCLIITAAFARDARLALVAGFRSRVIVAVVLAAGMVGAIHSLKGFSLYCADTPELAWVSVWPQLVWPLAVLAVLLLACWLFRARLAAYGFLLVFFPLVAAVAGFVVTKNGLLANRGTAYDFGSLVARRLITPQDRGKGAVVGEELGSRYRCLFHLDSQTDQIVKVAAGAPIEAGMIAADRRWALIVGQHELRIPHSSIIEGQGFSLVSFAPGVLVASSQPWDGRPMELTFTEATPGIVSGFHPIDAYCMWSRTESPAVQLPIAVDRRVRVRLWAQGYGPNANRTVTVGLGAGRASVTLAGNLQTSEVVLSPGTPARVLKFEGLKPASPAAWEGSPDVRTLGMCLRSVSIELTPEAF